MRKVKVLTCRPIRESASMRAGFEKDEGLNVTPRASNKRGAALDEKSWQTRRKLDRSWGPRCSRRLSRHWSFSQKRKKTELFDRTKLQMEPFERIDRPSTVVAGVNGISPNSNFELERETVVAALPRLLWLSPEYERFSGRGSGGGR